MKKDRFSVLTVTHNEAANLALLHESLVRLFSKLGVDWEWIVIDDHSSDRTFKLLSELAVADKRLRIFRLSRRFGMDSALRCALDRAKGSAAIIFPADLVYAPDVILSLVVEWRQGTKVVWAVAHRKFSFLSLPFLSWWLSRIPGASQILRPISGFVLIDRQVIDALIHLPETTGSFPLLISWMGFSEKHIECDRHSVRGTAREVWRKKFRRWEESVLSSSDFPFRGMTLVGGLFVSLGLFFSSIVVSELYFRSHVQNVAVILAAIFIIGGLQTWMLGVLGRYLWRTLQEARKRPRYVIEKKVDLSPVMEEAEREPNKSSKARS